MTVYIEITNITSGQCRLLTKNGQLFKVSLSELC